MSAKRNFYLGLFVVSGFALIVTAVFMFGMASIFRPKGYFYTCFSESVQGLEVGSPVKYKGVPIGSVKKITLDMDEQLIIVLMEVELDTMEFSGNKQENPEEKFLDFINNEQSKGLRCHLEYSGITGMKYVEMDYADNVAKIREISLAGIVPPASAYLPSAPSAISDMLTTLNDSLENIASVDFNKISVSLEANLAALEKLINNPDIPVLLENLRMTTTSLENFSANIDRNFTSELMQQTAADMHNLLVELSATSAALKAELESAEIGKISVSLQNSIESVEAAQQPFLRTLERVDIALDAVDVLVRQLSADPASLLRGSSVPPVDLQTLGK